MHCLASDTDDPTEQPRWGKIGKQKLTDEGPLAPGPNTGRTPYGGSGEGVGDAKYDMTTFDEVLVGKSIDFMKKAKDVRQAVLPVAQHHAHACRGRFLSEKYKAMMNAENGWYGMEEAGMAQMDDNIGAVMKALNDMGIADNTILVFSTDNGAEEFTWPDGGRRRSAAPRAPPMRAASACRRSSAGLARCAAGKVENGLFSGLDWFPTFLAAAGNSNIVDELKAGKDLGGPDLQGPSRRLQPARLPHRQGADEAAARSGTSSRPTLGGLRLDELQVPLLRPAGRLAGPQGSINMPIMVNLKQDPFERGPITNVAHGSASST